ncbi:MAG: nucleotide exchange factor GrpE [Lautropia sp.]|nr:nucleotide exchange factor GrpE [Lautropia sp.]
MFATDPEQADQPEVQSDMEVEDFSPRPAATMSADEQALMAEIEALRAELAEAENRATNNYEQFVRATAEGENIRRRATEDVAKAKKFAIESFAESLLPVCDSLEMALKVDAPTIDSIRQGAETTLRQLLHALERNKVVVVDPLGERFDPNTQQAISMQPSAEVPANHVVSVLQKGYLINDRVLRPAMVVVSQGG